MDAEKIERYGSLLALAEKMNQALSVLAEDPEDEQALEEVSCSFGTLQPYLSGELSYRILYLFSGAEIEPEDLREARPWLFNEIAKGTCQFLIESVSSCTYVEQGEADKLFLLWDKIPHTAAKVYQGIFDCCVKASVSAPVQAFEHMLRIFEEQPGLLSGEGNPHPDYVYRPSEQHTFDQCPICGGTGEPYYNAFAYQMADFRYPHLPAKLWMKCGSCGNLYTWKYPKELLKYSEVEQMVVPDPTKKLTAISETGGVGLSIWSNVLNKLRTYTNGTELLEVGIGEGDLLAVALEMGYQPDAVEIVPSIAHRVSDILGIPIWCGDFLHYAPDKTYSIITMGDVIEHVTDPEKALRNAYGLLRDDGVLWLSTPNFESSFSRIKKFYDPMWTEPYHISYFNRVGIEALAAKCGFTLREYCVSQRYNGSMELILTKSRH